MIAAQVKQWANKVATDLASDNKSDVYVVESSLSVNSDGTVEVNLRIVIG